MFLENISEDNIFYIVLPSIRAAEIVEYVRKYTDVSSQNLQSLSSYWPDPTRCFCSYGLCLNKSNHRVKQVDISEQTDINQSISINQFYPIDVMIFIRDSLVFPKSIIIQFFQLMWKEFVFQISEKPCICVVVS